MDHVDGLWIVSDGTPTQFPQNAWAWHDSSVPANWSEIAADTTYDDHYPLGQDAGLNGATTAVAAVTHLHGIGTHTHETGSHTHAKNDLFGSSDIGGVGTDQSVATFIHGHTFAASGAAVHTADASTDNTGNTNTLHPYGRYRARGIKADSNNFDFEVICLYNGTPGDLPADFVVCDGTDGTPDWYTSGASDVIVFHRTTQGHVAAATHTHQDLHNHGVSGAQHSIVDTSGASDNNSTIENTGALSFPTDTHTHTLSGSSTGVTATGSVSDATGTESATPEHFTVLAVQHLSTEPIPDGKQDIPAFFSGAAEVIRRSFDQHKYVMGQPYALWFDSLPSPVIEYPIGVSGEQASPAMHPVQFYHPKHMDTMGWGWTEYWDHLEFLMKQGAYQPEIVSVVQLPNMTTIHSVPNTTSQTPLPDTTNYLSYPVATRR
jgi:hypothetical protein